MILLDTNVVSELTKTSPDVSVQKWFLHTSPKTTFITAITMAELHYGVALLPESQRKQHLIKLVDAFLATSLETPVLPFDEQAPKAYASIMAKRRQLGRVIPELDCQIAAIAYTFQATLATRNTADFEHTGITLINPWSQVIK